ncbi:hypothetical protein [Duganella sp. P38]|uniref:hypothetical protein n=1 Tax=Duganella sp. P38 TaxID=3423949 RepID=UPI003D799283
MKNFKFSSLLLAPLFAALAACGGGGGGDSGGGGTPAAVTLKSIAITSDKSTINVNTTQQLTATGTYSDGSTKAVPGLTWATKSGAATVASVAASGTGERQGRGQGNHYRHPRRRQCVRQL